MDLVWPCSEFEKFSHCTISQGNELLACCIADNIHLYPLCNPAGQSFQQLPPGHLGRIEFCQFLKGTRYLISHGVDGAVFLWDLCEWKAVAYARITQGRENILNIRVSPEEDKVVCLTSLGQLSMITLCGLKSGTIPSEFPSLGVAGGQGLTSETSRRQPQEQPRAVSQCATVSNNEEITEAMDVDMLLEEMDYFASSDVSEGSDEDESDAMLTD